MSIPRDNYVGEPDYPTPWTTKQPREGLRDIDEARIVSLSPDVCLTPIGSSVVPIPYPIVDYCGHDKGYTPSVRFTGKKAMVMRSCTTHVHGDAPGNRKGVKSGAVEDICEPIEHADQVRAEGSHVIRHLDRFWMNNRNTQGEANFVRGTETFAPPEDDDPIPGSLRWKGSDEGKVVSDASPEPLIMGAQYADAGSALRKVAPQQSAGNAQPATQPKPLPQPQRPQTTRPFPPAANDNVYQRRGTFGRPLPTGAGRVLGLLGLAQAGYQLGDMAGRWYVGPDGVMARAIGDHLRGQVPITSTQAQEISNLPWHMREWFSGNATILNANDILSLKAGVPLDFRTMDPDDLADLLEAPWPSAEQLRKNAERIGERRAPAALPVPENVRVEQEREKRRCRIDTYEKMEPICKSIGMQAHHIVPDWTLRYGTRKEAIVGEKRIPNMPGFWQGQSMCVVGQARTQGTEHNDSHLADGAIEALGRNSNPPFTATLDDVKDASIDAMTSVRPDCAAQIIAAVNGEFAGRDPNQLLRAKQYPPLPSDTLNALQTGAKRGANARP